VNRKTLSILCIICLLGIFLRLAWASIHPVFPSDSKQYTLLARNLISGHGFSLSSQVPFHPTDFRPPLYPFVLASLYGTLGESVQNIFYLQAILGGLSTLCLFFLGKKFGDEKGGLLAAFLFAVHLPAIGYAGTPLTETLYIFLILLGTLLAIPMSSFWRAASSGMILALAILTRQEAMAYTIVLVMALVIIARDKENVLKKAFVLLGVALLTMTPWVVRNYTIFGQIEVSDSSLLFRNLMIGSLDWTRALEAKYPYQHSNGKVLSTQERGEQRELILNDVYEEIRTHPLDYASRRIRQIVGLLLYDGDLVFTTERPLSTAIERRDWAYLLVRASFWTFWGILPLLFAVWGTWIGIRKNKQMILLLIYPLMTLGTSLFIWTEYRLGVAGHTLLLVPASVALLALAEKAKGLCTNR